MTNFRGGQHTAPTLLASLLATGLAAGIMLMPATQTLAQADAVQDTADTGEQQATGEESAEEQAIEERPAPNNRMAGMEELPVGRVGSGDNSGGVDVSYRFYAPVPGLITAAVRAKHGADMTIRVNDANGTQLPNARCDIDFNGAGNEHLVVLLPAPGWYEVIADPLGSGGDYWISGSFLAVGALEGIEAPATPEAPEPTEIVHGQTIEATVAGSRANEAWFHFTAPADGMVIFHCVGTSRSGDLTIESFAGENRNNRIDYTDDDRQGSTTNELTTYDMREGQTVHFKVVSISSSNCTFNATARFLPDDLEIPAAPAQQGEGHGEEAGEAHDHAGEREAAHEHAEEQARREEAVREAQARRAQAQAEAERASREAEIQALREAIQAIEAEE